MTIYLGTGEFFALGVLTGIIATLAVLVAIAVVKK
jgi:hypothetical protein